MNKSLLNSIIYDNKLAGQDQDSMLTELEAVPESYVNVLFDKSLDEMSSDEQQESVQEVKNYLEQNA